MLFTNLHYRYRCAARVMLERAIRIVVNDTLAGEGVKGVSENNYRLELSTWTKCMLALRNCPVADRIIMMPRTGFPLADNVKKALETIFEVYQSGKFLTYHVVMIIAKTTWLPVQI